jgi:hypothetical protein
MYRFDHKRASFTKHWHECARSSREIGNQQLLSEGELGERPELLHRSEQVVALSAGLIFTTTTREDEASACSPPQCAKGKGDAVHGLRAELRVAA